MSVFAVADVAATVTAASVATISAFFGSQKRYDGLTPSKHKLFKCDIKTQPNCIPYYTTNYY